MEMQQIRYFLAVSRTLNFSRAAEECNVTQPSLTRAIKQLEAELSGDLFRRERPAALTELGLRMHPLLKQCYDSAVGAQSLASSLKTGEVGTLRIALTHAVDLALLIPHLHQLKRVFDRLEFKLLRGTSEEVGELLKKGEVELGIAAAIDEVWDRLDNWSLFAEGFHFVVSKDHPLAKTNSVTLDSLRTERFLSRNYCEYDARLSDSLRAHQIDVDHSHETSSERDLIELVEADIGVALMPFSAPTPDSLTRIHIDNLDVRRTVKLYGVAGRERTAVATAVMKLLRGADWSQYASGAVHA
jgi:DNA-binding transcriptional LysR family regulator